MQAPSPTPMDFILQEIERAFNAGFYYLAIVLALTLPDICEALADPRGKSSPEKYMDWFCKNLATKYPQMTDEDCYSLRCGVVHEGRFGHKGSQYARIMFTVPNARNIRIRLVAENIGGRSDKVLSLDAKEFCDDMIQSVRNWYSDAKENPNVQSNLPRMVQFRPNGMEPWIVGLPLIA